MSTYTGNKKPTEREWKVAIHLTGIIKQSLKRMMTTKGRSCFFLLFLLCRLLKPAWSFTAPPAFVFPKNRQGFDWSARTRVFVSELHVPGYAETKLPFLLPDNSESITLQIPPDTVRLIPFRDGHLLHQTTRPIFTVQECESIMHEAESVASRIAWTTNRHGNFPTTDLPLVELPATLQFLRRALVERIYPALRQQFGTYVPDPHKLRVADGFVVKYDAKAGQKELKPHRDGSVLSFNVALNPSDQYEGGGTWFASLDDAIRLEQGAMVSHASGLLHGGHNITQGQRYILVAFVILEDYDSWSMRFYNQVRNL